MGDVIIFATHEGLIIATAAAMVTNLVISTLGFWIHACMRDRGSEREKRCDDGGWLHC